jgi:hypothetical protein
VLPITANQNVIWSSSEGSEDIVYVDDFGNLAAIGLGTAIITATTEDGNYSATRMVTIEEATATGGAPVPEVDPFPEAGPEKHLPWKLIIIVAVAAIVIAVAGILIGRKIRK